MMNLQNLGKLTVKVSQILTVFTFFLFVNDVYAQTTNIVKGVIKDKADQSVLPGVAVTIKGTTYAVMADAGGNYSIRAKKGDFLVFSFIGFETQAVLYNDQTNLNVNMVASANNLNEVVVIGYGAVKKGDLTGSVAQVDLSELVKAPVLTFSEALAGRIAGVQVVSTDGQPGAISNIVIRGANTLNTLTDQPNSPLYVIDGFPIEDPDLAAINSNDVESINILKDASATAIYGSRGANGVILIETKKGKAGKSTIAYNNAFGTQRQTNEVDLMSPYEFVKYYAELYPTETDESYLSGKGRTLEDYKSIGGVNWQDEILRKSAYQTHNLSLRGGSGQSSYSFSGSIYDQSGVVMNSDFKQYQGRVSIDQQVNSKLKVGGTLNYSKAESNGEIFSATDSRTIDTYSFYATWAYRPVYGDTNFDLLNEDFDLYENLGVHTVINPVTQRKNDYTIRATKTMMANGYLNYKFSKKLNFRINAGSSNNFIRTDKFNNSKTPLGRIHPNNSRGVNSSTVDSEKANWNVDGVATYQAKLANVHNITVMGGLSFQENTTKRGEYRVQNITEESLLMQGVGTGIPYMNTRNLSTNTLASTFARFNYSYKDKYLFTGTFRADGSSKFPTDNRWGYFPSASLAWQMTKEDLFKLPRIISTSKLRVSYGSSGNNRVTDYPYLSALSFLYTNAYSFNNALPTISAVVANPLNKNLKWETTKQFNIGYDLGLLKDKLQLTVDYYNKKTTDLLLFANLPLATGFANAYDNIGSIQNKGLEFTLNANLAKTKKFTWDLNFNISFNQNKILALTQSQENMFSVAYLPGYILPLYTAEIGQPAGMFYGYVFDGVYQYSDFENTAPGVYVLKNDVPTNIATRTNSIQPGDIKYKDLNGDGIVSAQDQAIIGKGQPLHVGGFTNSFKYKSFDLNILFQWSYGNDIYNANRLLMEGNVNKTIFRNQYASYQNRWTPENQSNTLFRADGQGPIVHSSRVIEDGSYLRLKTLSLGYNVSPKLLSKIKISQLRVNIAAQNLWTLTNYSGMDPEVSVRNSVLTPGFDFSAYPRANTIVLGLNASF